MDLAHIALRLRSDLRHQKFGPPIAWVYNPVEYSWPTHAEYLRRFGRGRREIVLVGMNPGPWGMVQTGVPFGDVEMVSNWLGITGRVGKPRSEHPRRPVEGFLCHRSEISGRRLWGWARDTYGTPGRFFARFFVMNYCPLCFFEADGTNRTPDRLPTGERASLFAACDDALRALTRCLRPRLVIGIGRFAESRARAALSGMPVVVAGALHPSGANPRASRDWGGQMNATLRALGATR
ncbi:MAG: single-stranded DNA-binding protein [Acidobacteriia bacterium]|nr:single-stranded DNA-binding protein [Terriglobia bacterium]